MNPWTTCSGCVKHKIVGTDVGIGPCKQNDKLQFAHFWHKKMPQVTLRHLAFSKTHPAADAGKGVFQILIGRIVDTMDMASVFTYLYLACRGDEGNVCLIKRNSASAVTQSAKHSSPVCIGAEHSGFYKV